jgi:hypothetical protein
MREKDMNKIEQSDVECFKESIQQRNIHNIAAWLRIMTKQFGLSQADYKTVIAYISQDHKDFPDLDV